MADYFPDKLEFSSFGLWGTTPWNARVRLATVNAFSPMNGIDSTAIGKAIETRWNSHDALVAQLQEARLQIEYLDTKFQATGTSAAVLTRIEQALKSALPTGEAG